MYQLLETRSAEKELDNAPKEILAKYEFWKNVAQISGINGLKAHSGFKDHALKGEWQGARSSYLNQKWRVIYWVDETRITITIVRVSSHNYKRN